MQDLLLLKTTLTEARAVFLVAQTLRPAFLQLFSPIPLTAAQTAPHLGSLPGLLPPGP